MNIIKSTVALIASLGMSLSIAANELEYRVYNIDYSMSDSALLEHSINSPVRVLGKSILILIPASDHSVAPSQFSPDSTSIARFTDMVKQQIRTPVRTLLKGEYRAGADPYTRGTVYQAGWSDKGMKLGIKYQF